MNGFDIALLVLLVVLVLVGLFKGLARILIGIGALVAAFALAATFHGELAASMRVLNVAPELKRLLAYLGIFLGTMLAGGLVAWFARRMLKAAMLGWADRLAGAALGLVAALLVAALMVLPLVAYSPLGERVLRGSVLAPYVSVVADVANRVAPDDLSEQYRRRMDDLRRYWRDRWHESAAGTPSSV